MNGKLRKSSQIHYQTYIIMKKDIRVPPVVTHIQTCSDAMIVSNRDIARCYQWMRQCGMNQTAGSGAFLFETCVLLHKIQNTTVSHRSTMKNDG